eukprot:jgi/Mesen1/6072/ME000031S05340
MKIRFRDEHQGLMTTVSTSMIAQKEHHEEAFLEPQQEYRRCLAPLHDTSAEVSPVTIVATESHSGLKALGRLHKGSSKRVRALTSISDLPESILEHILRSACVDTLGEQDDRRREKISETQVKDVTRLCTTWRDVVRASYTCAAWNYSEDVDVALSQLRTLRNVTHIRVLATLSHKDMWFLKELAVGFPLLTSFHLSLLGKEKDLEILSLFLSLKTDIQELHLVLDIDLGHPTDLAAWDSHRASAWDSYRKALENMDFSQQVQLKKLTFDFSNIFEDLADLPNEFCIPISKTIALLVNLQELHVHVEHLAEVASLPPWLADFPAFVGFRIQESQDPLCSVFLDSLGRMTGLKEVVMFGHALEGPECEAISKLSQLTSLVIMSVEECDMDPEEDLLWRLSSTLQKLECWGNTLSRVDGSLPLLEELKLEQVSSPEASELTLFAGTPNVRSLKLSLVEEEGAWPHLEHLTGLTSLSLDLGISEETYDEEQPLWHMCPAQVPALEVLELKSCRLLRLIDGLLALEPQVAVGVFCTCHSADGTWVDFWFSSHAEHITRGSVCNRLPADVARQLFKGTRRPTARPPGPCPTCPTFRKRDLEDEDPEADDAEGDGSGGNDSNSERAEGDNPEDHHVVYRGA